MKKFKSVISENPLWLTGVLFIALSFLVFVAGEFIPEKEENYFGIFVVNYGLAIIYFLILLVSSIKNFKSKFYKNKIEYTLLHLILSLISCFSLNRVLPIFETSTMWLSIQLILMGVSLIALIFFNQFSEFVKHMLFFTLGINLMVCLYFALYLTPYYPIGLVAFFILGFSLHLFIPLLLFIYSIIAIKKYVRQNSKLIGSLSMGIVLSLAFIIYFSWRWNTLADELNKHYNLSSIGLEDQLPPWVKISQSMYPDWISERIIKSDLVYVTPDFSSSFFRVPNLGSFGEQREHDPLLFTASLFADAPKIEVKDKIKILESMYGSRHEAEERLWSGNSLSCTNIISDVLIYPEIRAAYTEKVITIKNNGSKNRWRNQEEAIFTFSLPEGSVVTSLSLWIGGKEEKAILTSKQKADTAYKTIVGVEARDPSLIHWKEGNMVSARVFPCTPHEDRKFKIGVTTPLLYANNSLNYQNLRFDGPSADYARETIHVKLTEGVEGLTVPSRFNSISEREYTVNDTYEEDWNISFRPMPVIEKKFSFNDFIYSIKEPELKYMSFHSEDIYLDLNCAWDKHEFDEVMKIFKDQDIYVYDEGLIKLDATNSEELFNKLFTQRFSLFPVFEINSKNALLITKGSMLTPNVKDLEGSIFSSKLKNYLNHTIKINLYSIDNGLTPYLKTLKEFRFFNYDHGNLIKLNQLVKDKKYKAVLENDHTILIEPSGLIIDKQPGKTVNTGPDHIMRLYAYNSLLKDIGSKYFENNHVEDPLVQRAQEAYVVSPLTSLVVLETQADYDRFDIKKTENSLNNASMNSSGAVPEPEEWMMIILALIVIGYLLVKKRSGIKYV